MSALEPVDGQDGERRQDWARDLADRMALVAAWGERGLCQACGEHRATRLLPADEQFSAVKLCDACAEGDVTVPLAEQETVPVLQQFVEAVGGDRPQAGRTCQRCGGPRPDSLLRLCRPCGKDLVRRVQAYQVVSVPGLGAGRTTIDVRVGVN